MDIEADFLVNPFSYILGAISVVGFFIVARHEIRLWLHQRFGKRRAAVRDAIPDFGLPGRRVSIILGLLFMGIVFSALIFIFNEKVEKLAPNITLSDFLLIMFAFTMLPGGLAGMSAGAWINTISRSHQEDNLLERLLAGTLVYVAFITVVELSGIHPLLFFCGPAVTLLVYRFSPV